jgi:murein DD-endopeptidase MepM/ murein hydrolase activator NlpD
MIAWRRNLPWVIAGVAVLAAATLGGVALFRRGAPPKAALSLDLPLDCTVGQDCLVQNYVDEDPGPGFKDYTCGPQGYNGHDGTDIRIPTMADMRRGVVVKAAAAGVVLRIRDEVPDTGIPPEGVDGLKGMTAGNAVVIDHGGGWQTLYGHLKRGSVRVKPGDRVERGQALGQVGLSGNTQFPHLHLTVHKIEPGQPPRPVDPFVGESPIGKCGGDRRPLWSPAASAALAYRPASVFAAGFSDGLPEMDKAVDGAYLVPLPGDPGAIVAWGLIQGVRLGDHVRARFEGPGGMQAEDDFLADRNLAVSMRAAGKKRPPAGWPPGRYAAIVSVVRDGKEVASRRVEIER